MTTRTDANVLSREELTNVIGGQVGMNWDGRGFPIIRTPQPGELQLPRVYTGRVLDDFSEDSEG